jgi:hypothetical protein
VPLYVVEVVEWLRFRGQDRSHYTELVSNGVLHDNPRMFTLADVDTLRTQLFEALHLGLLGCVDGTDIQVQPVLMQLLIRRYAEDNRRRSRMATSVSSLSVTR